MSSLASSCLLSCYPHQVRDHSQHPCCLSPLKAPSIAPHKNSLKTVFNKTGTNLIEPYRHSDDSPPFSVAELVVMAIICSDKSYPHKSDIFAWIIYTFRYYSALAVPQYVNWMSGCLYGWIGCAHNVVHGFQKVFRQYEVPLIQHSYPLDEFDGDPSTWTIKPSQARLFLFSHLERPGSFSFDSSISPENCGIAFMRHC